MTQQSAQQILVDFFKKIVLDSCSALIDIWLGDLTCEKGGYFSGWVGGMKSRPNKVNNRVSSAWCKKCVLLLFYECRICRTTGCLMPSQKTDYLSEL